MRPIARDGDSKRFPAAGLESGGRRNLEPAKSVEQP